MGDDPHESDRVPAHAEGGRWADHQLRVGRRNRWDADGARLLRVEGRRTRLVALDRGEWGPFNITVVSMCPAIWTPMYEEYRRREPAEIVALSDRMLEGTDADRDMGPVMVFLASTGAGAISGQYIQVGKINVAF